MDEECHEDNQIVWCCLSPIPPARRARWAPGRGRHDPRAVPGASVAGLMQAGHTYTKGDESIYRLTKEGFERKLELLEQAKQAG